MLEVICGGMFSGKTTKLIKRVKRARMFGQSVQLFRPDTDTRSPPENTSTHKGIKEGAIVVPADDPIEILRQANAFLVAIDEAQFFDSKLIWVVQELQRTDRAKVVVCAGLDLDILERPFGSMPSLMALADKLKKLHAECVICGGKASRSYRPSFDETKGSVLLVGASEYEARCSSCFRKGSAVK
jgi:thymidine kinase